MRNEAYLWYAAVTKDAAERRSWTFYKAVIIDIFLKSIDSKSNIILCTDDKKYYN